MPVKIDRRVTVTEAAGLGQPVELAVTVALPDPTDLPERPIIIFAAPGGGYSRGYFDLQLEGHVGYSEADFHSTRGTIYVMIDHVGVGESTIPNLSRVTFQIMLACHDHCVRQIGRDLAEGTFSSDFPACPDSFYIGEGQSMGGIVTLATQSRFRTFDAIALCGSSAICNIVPQCDQDVVQRLKREFFDLVIGNGQSINFEDVDFAYAWHWEDTPQDIIHDDMKGGYPARVSTPPYGSLTLPSCGVETMVAGRFLADAARIEVPVMLAFGARDVTEDPRAELAAYKNSPDISLFITPRMAHMHNFASTRELLWSRLHNWSRMIAG